MIQYLLSFLPVGFIHGNISVNCMVASLGFLLPSCMHGSIWMYQLLPELLVVETWSEELIFLLEGFV
jgi:hypothetical protein